MSRWGKSEGERELTVQETKEIAPLPLRRSLQPGTVQSPVPACFVCRTDHPPLRHPAPYSSQGLFWCTLVIRITGSTVARPLHRHPDKAAASHRPQCPCGSSRFCSPGVSLSFSEVSRLRPAAISIPVPIHPVQGNSAQHI